MNCISTSLEDMNGMATIKLKHLLSEILSESEGTEPNIYYHVTREEHVKKIKKYGLKPRQKGEWTGAFNQDIRQHKGVYVFDNYYDTMKWAFKMQWNNKGDKIVILKLRSTDTDFVDDTHWEANLDFGKWLVKLTAFKPQDLIEIIPFSLESWTPELTRKINSLKRT